jgi:SAM-dependent methyltransferase
MRELGASVGADPYLLIQNCVVNPAAIPDSAERTSWETRCVALGAEMEIPRQYLRRLLANLATQGDAWDWAAAPGMSQVEELCEKFHRWLPEASGLDICRARSGIPQIKFLDNVRACNKTAYDAIAQDYAAVHHQPDPAMHEAIEKFAEFCLGADTNKGRQRCRQKLVLDVGCGPGIHLALLRDKGFKCVGIDSSKAMLQIARGNLSKPRSARASDYKLIRGDLFDLSAVGEMRFDAIWSSAVMVHVPRRYAVQFVSSLYKLLRPGGIVYLSAQSGGDAVMRSERRFFIYYTEGEIEAIARAAGFSFLKRWHRNANRGTCGDRRTKRWLNYFLQKPTV